MLYFPSARYKKTRDVDCELVEKEIEREIRDSIRNMPEPTCQKDVEIAVQKATEILRKGSERLNNCVLYDGSGCELAIYSEKEFSNGTYLMKPLIRYQKSTERLSLYCTGKSNIPSKEANSSLLESILNISPNFA